MRDRDGMRRKTGGDRGQVQRIQRLSGTTDDEAGRLPRAIFAKVMRRETGISEGPMIVKTGTWLPKS